MAKLKTTQVLIRAIRRKTGWSQARLAQELKINLRSVGRYERNERQPTMGVYLDIHGLWGRLSRSRVRA